MTKSSKTAIPVPVLDLLKEKWRLPDGYCRHERIFVADEERQRNPSYYFIRGEVEYPEMMSFSKAEADALDRAGVFRGQARQETEVTTVNEHILHALEDFLGETYEAWSRFEKRREDILAKAPEMAD